MGKLYHYQCNNCNNQFEFTKDPIMAGHVVHCLDCGKEQLVAPDDLPLELWGYHTFDFEWEPELSDNESKLITVITGPCSCGGCFSLKASPRCPKYHSLDVTKDESLDILID